ncbi:MAG: hypothetical protein V9G19_22385 [Tetrasphaera sp.]
MLGSDSRISHSEIMDLDVLADHEAQIILISRDGQPLDALELYGVTLRHQATGIVVESVDQNWVTAGRVVAIQANWVVALSLLGVLLLTLATGWAIAGDVIRTSTEIQAIARAAEKRRWLTSVAASETCLPLVATASIASGAYYILALGLTTGATYVTPP